MSAVLPEPKWRRHRLEGQEARPNHLQSPEDRESHERVLGDPRGPRLGAHLCTHQGQ